MEIKSKYIDRIYMRLCDDLLDAPEVNGTREINNVKITLTNIENNVISCRNLSLPYMLGELLWYFNGRNDAYFISKFGSMWSRISDDGVTNNSAYGYTLMKKHGFDQIEKIIELLKIDPYSRRAVLNINEANEHVIETKDEPCTIAIQFLLRDGKLNCTAMMRSNDIWFGFPYDVVFFTELQKYVATRLGVEYGEYTHFATSLHVYDKDLEKISDLKPDNKKVYINSGEFHVMKRMLAEIMAVSRSAKYEIVEYAKYYGIIREVTNEDKID